MPFLKSSVKTKNEETKCIKLLEAFLRSMPTMSFTDELKYRILDILVLPGGDKDCYIRFSDGFGFFIIFSTEKLEFRVGRMFKYVIKSGGNFQFGVFGSCTFAFKKHKTFAM